MKQHLSIILILIPSLLFSQKYDYQWPFGYLDSLPINFGVSILDFNKDNVVVYPYGGVDFRVGDAGGSTICDSKGQLLMMTDNCRVLDRDFNLVEGSDTLTPGITHDQFCPSRYPGYQSSLFVPELSNDSTYYLIHKDADFWPEKNWIVARNMYLSKFVVKENGKIYLKEKKKLYNQNMRPGDITSIVNKKKTKWWVFTILYQSNKFIFWEIGENKIIKKEIQITGPKMLRPDEGINATFSPNGKMLAINNVKLGILLYDFNNETGDINFRTNIKYPHMKHLGSLCFSPNSRFIYATAPEDLYQIDLEDDNKVEHVGHYWGFDSHGWPVGLLGNMYIGPDCRIYFGSGGTAIAIHTILEPDKKGIACTFVAKAILPPTTLSHNFANQPMYRALTGCEYNIGWPFSTDLKDLPTTPSDILVYPNPAQDKINIMFDEPQKKLDITIYNSIGTIVLNKSIDFSSQSYTVNLEGIPNGVYFLTSNKRGFEPVKFIIQN